MSFERENIEAVYPLSPMQAGMVYHSTMDPESGVYVEQLSGLFRGDLNVRAFCYAWQRVVEQTPVLRTSFAWERPDKMLQMVHRGVELPIREEDWSGLGISECDERLRVFLAEDRREGFDLTRPPLVRLALFHLPDGALRFVWTFHHAILDGWSHPLLLRDVLAWYKATLHGIPPRIPPRRPYREYIEWLQVQDRAASERFWNHQLENLTAPSPLVIDGVRTSAGLEETGYEKESIVLSAEFSAALLSLAQSHRVTLNAFIQGAWSILLNRYSGEQDIVFGTVVSGRPTEIAGVEAMVGLFVNTLPVRIRLEPGKGALEVVKELHHRQFDLRRFEYTPLVDIQRLSALPRNTPLFESIVVFENYPHDESLFSALEGVEVVDVHSYEQTNYPLTVVASFHERLNLEMGYARDHFQRETIRNALGHLTEILQQMIAFPDISVGRLKLLPENEERQVMLASRGRPTEFPTQWICAHQWFDRQVDKSPDATAVVCETRSLTYGELQDRANRLAGLLLREGVGPDSVIGLHVDRSEWMVIGMLGVWKAGGAFLPLDPAYPRSRLQWMLSDSTAGIVLTTHDHAGDLDREGVRSYVLDGEEVRLNTATTDIPLPDVSLGQLAYIVYTSGSTGQPKGVLVEHRGLTNLSYQEQIDWEVGTGSRVLQSAPFGFDAAISEILLALLSGGTLFIPPRRVLIDPVLLWTYLRDHRISQMTVGPALLGELNDDGLDGLRTVVSATDVCPPQVARRWERGRKFFNGYGPTETTVGACWHHCGTDADLSSPPPIGRPIGNVQMYLLDPSFNLLPVGVGGEIFIAGAGVGRGYLHQSDQTAERFVPDPYGTVPGARMFRTGDRGRLRSDGTFEFLGRIDHQVKIRGFRIEPGEIEHCLERHPSIGRAVVVARTDATGQRNLIAYVVASSPERTLQLEDLQSYLRSSLPEHMVPSRIVNLDAFPLTPNGKIDRSAFPDPEHPAGDGSASPGGASSATEQIVAGIMERVLGLRDLGPGAHFFELGGHSLRVTQMVNRLREAFGVDIPVAVMFDHPTVRELAGIIERERERGAKLSTLPPLDPVTREKALPLSYAQQRLWFLQQLAPDDTSYVIPLLLRLSGRLNVDVLRAALDVLVSRHEVLRTTFPSEGGIPAQRITEEGKMEMRDRDALDASDEEIAAIIRSEVDRPFDLATGPLFRLLLVRTGEEDYTLVCTLHHIIADGWSADILVREVSAVYEAIFNHAEPLLPPLTIQYADFSWWQRQWLEGEVLESQCSYWKTALGGLTEALELPTDRPRPANHSSRGASTSLDLTPDLIEAAQEQCRQESVSLFMLALSAYLVLLHKYSGQDDIVVGSPVAGRRSSELDYVVGFFVNTLPLRARFAREMTLRDLLVQVRRVCLGALDNQDFPFEKIVEDIQPTRQVNRSPLFQTAFIFQEDPPATISLPGVTVTPIQPETRTAKYDLSLALLANSDGMQANLEYNTDLFDEETISRMLRHYRRALETIVADADQRVADLSFLEDREQRQVLREWNQTSRTFVDHHGLVRWFEEVSGRVPDAVAVESAAAKVSYRELNQRANRLARHLQQRGVGKYTSVGILLDRSVEMAVAFWGILKAGGAAVPLDPSYPAERLQFMITDSDIKVLLSTQALIEAHPFHTSSVLLLDVVESRAAQGDEEILDVAEDPRQLAYVLYTSGTTGVPRGVAVQRGSLVNLVEALSPVLGITESLRVLQFSSPSFDVAVQDLVLTHLNGGTLVVPLPEDLLTGQGIWQTLLDRKIALASISATVLAAVPSDPLPDLQTLVVGGERCTSELVARWRPGRRLFNAYGPTESTVCVAIHPVEQEWPQGPPIGRPVANTQLYILDSALRPVPIGVPGELCVGGIALARGYHGRPDATAEKFLPDPYSEVPGARIYRTGDLVRFLPDGNIEFLRRIDTQVKVRGFRIELGELESLLVRHPAVRDAAVIVREDVPGDKRIVAYIAPREGMVPAVQDLRDHLRRHVPAYMVPSAFVILEELPLSPNGKVNRRALLPPDKSRPDLMTAFVEPRTQTERTLAELSATLLMIDRVGVHDHFFDLGGHSLLATQLIARIQDTFRVNLPLREVFETPTVAALAERIDTLQQHAHSDFNEIAGALEHVAHLSDSEVKALLGNRENQE